MQTRYCKPQLFSPNPFNRPCPLNPSPQTLDPKPVAILAQAATFRLKLKMKCHWCGSEPCLEPRLLKSNLVGCAVCREVDRLRGIVNLIPVVQHPNLLNELRIFNSRFRDWTTTRFGGPPVDYQAPPPQPEASLSHSIKARPQEPAGPPPSWVRSSASDRHRPTVVARPALPRSRAAASAEPESTGTTETKHKRKKKNKGQRREDWKRARSGIYRGREDPIGETVSDAESDSNLD